MLIVQLIMELSRFDLLLQLSSVHSTLSPERQNFLEQIQYTVSSTFPASLIEGTDPEGTPHVEMSQLITPITDARILLNKVI